MSKYRVKILAYETGQTNPVIDEKRTGILFPDLEKIAHKLVSKAISKNGFEMILDIFEETEGAK